MIFTKKKINHFQKASQRLFLLLLCLFSSLSGLLQDKPAPGKPLVFIVKEVKQLFPEIVTTQKDGASGICLIESFSFPKQVYKKLKTIIT
jgi:hypothetical protein